MASTKATTATKSEDITTDIITRIGVEVVKEFADFKRYLGHNIQLEHLADVKFNEYWSNVEKTIREQEKMNND